MADSDVKLKHKVQLRKKVEEPAVTVEADGGNTPMPSTPKSNKWIWVILGIVAVCIICYFIFSNSGDKPVTETTQETEIVEEDIVPTDSVSDKEEATENILPATESEVTNTTDDQEVKGNEVPASDNNSIIATSSSSSAIVSSDVETEAMKVIRGDYGVGQERKDKLGNKYQTIQSRVNELKREGIF